MMNTHQGGCHCKAVRYEVELDFTQPVLECNCSHCEMNGLLLLFVPASRFTLLSGEDILTDYRFNTGRIRHRFCSVCSMECFGEGEHNGNAMRAINVRTIDNIDIAALTRKPFNGKDM